MAPTRTERLQGCLIGTAVGDALLLPSEGLARRRVARHRPLRHRLVAGRGLLSDDTEHAFLTAQSLLAAGDDADRFGQALAARLRWWFIALPPGIGLATAKGCIRLWLGWSWRRSGTGSAGNGAAMRAAVIGAAIADDERRRRCLAVSTAITHCDPRALAAAGAVAETAARIIADAVPTDIFPLWRAPGDPPAWTDAIAALERAWKAQATVDEVAAALGQPESVTGYACTSVPVALYAWLRHRAEPTEMLERVHACGGDVDTMGAIAGALAGLDRGPAAFPAEWVGRIVDHPLSLAALRRAGAALAEGGAPVRWRWWLQPARNLIALGIILAHGIGRTLRLR